MKKFTVSAIMAMGVVALSSAAFAGTTSHNFRGMVTGSALAANTVVPNDTVVPEQKNTTVKTEQFWLADTVVPTDTVAPEKNTEEKKQDEKGGETTTLADTVVPADTLTPAK